MSYVPKPQFWPRIGSPWLGLSSNSARMNPTASRNLFKPLPALREPIFGPTSQNTSIYGQTPDQPPFKGGRYLIQVGFAQTAAVHRILSSV